MSVTLSDEQFSALMGVVKAQGEKIEELDERVDDVESENKELRERVDAHEKRLDATNQRIDRTREMTSELQSREFEKGAHLLAENVEPDRIDVADGQLERVKKDDGRAYLRLPGSEDGLLRGGAVTTSTADLLPIQRLARYDDEMLASVTKRRRDELAAKAWREKDNPGRYELWSKGGPGVRAYLTSSDLTDWIRARETGVSKKYAQKLARETLESLREFSNGRLAKKKKNRRTDGLPFKELQVRLDDDVDLPGETRSFTDDDGPATNEVAGD